MVRKFSKHFFFCQWSKRSAVGWRTGRRAFSTFKTASLSRGWCHFGSIIRFRPTVRIVFVFRGCRLVNMPSTSWSWWTSCWLMRGTQKKVREFSVAPHWKWNGNRQHPPKAGPIHKGKKRIQSSTHYWKPKGLEGLRHSSRSSIFIQIGGQKGKSAEKKLAATRLDKHNKQRICLRRTFFGLKKSWKSFYDFQSKISLWKDFKRAANFADRWMKESMDMSILDIFSIFSLPQASHSVCATDEMRAGSLRWTNKTASGHQQRTREVLNDWGLGEPRHFFATPIADVF